MPSNHYRVRKVPSRSTRGQDENSGLGSSKDLDESISLILSGLNCPRALTVYLLWKYEEHDQLVQLSFCPEYYNSYDSLRDALAATELLSKAKFLQTTVDKKTAAFDSFLAAEKQCLETNRRLLQYEQKYSSVQNLVQYASHIAGKVLGDVDFDKILDFGTWGPGTSSTLRGRKLAKATKYHHNGGSTSELLRLHNQLKDAGFAPLWQCSYSATLGSRLLFVPKNAKIDRTIAAEPDLNIWYQKGVGRVIRNRLKRWGVDLDDQGRNQQLARRAYSENLITVDMKAASDTIAYETVHAILPRNWFYLLDLLRSPATIYNGNALQLEKFSSMGNGYTFELESLIFFCCAKAVCAEAKVDDSSIGVYGDDIIIPRCVFERFLELVTYLGFTLNSKKTHVSGVYYESCGHHYAYGQDVRPIYLKERLSKDVKSYYKLANSIRLLANRRCADFACDRRLLPAWRHLFTRIPPNLRHRIPLGFGLDSGIIDNFDMSLPSLRVRRHSLYQRAVYQFTALIPQPVTYEIDHSGVLLASLDPLRVTFERRITDVDEAGHLESDPNNPPFRGIVKYRFKKCSVFEWSDIGPWA
ncbi:RNA-directed RNA polymerase [ssRNA phage SRR7976325_16]|uniref:RNA-directed RNA polymerase n=1 Tax=ssRNA phage SRR7976325_16 TaxID=2786703 RepID=A0A8S5L5N0_9VIRU|nr:RNA-directed RNA polymerase [ssRNA phage SRR7976325_16]DAD52759.1 TPA_asm: RNA-directed RNA polymerase [ssRNA phage SRR7976325_16]